MERYVTPEWLELSSPSKDRPLVPAVERIARHLRQGASDLEQHVSSLDFEGLYRPTRAGLGYVADQADLPWRSAWALIGEWLVSWVAGHHDGTATIGDTHAWFWDGRDVDHLGNLARQRVVPTAITSRPEVRALLPYLLDPSSIATRRNVLSERSDLGERANRKLAGTYYTPGDVAVQMVRRIQGADKAPQTWLDPAQGSGVFLRAALCLSEDYDGTRESLYGIDIDPFAAEATSFVLTAEDLIAKPNIGAPWKRWHHFRRNLATGNSLFIDSTDAPDRNDAGPGSSQPWSITSAFPEVVDGRFSRIVANPPYIRLPIHPLNKELADLHPATGGTASADISPIFVELGLNLLKTNGAMSVVLPLSAVVSSRRPFPQLRRKLASEQARTTFESFDRVPDALFGDDIKTRNSIVTVDRSAPRKIISTPLHRWTSRRRDLAFGSAPEVEVTKLDGVPDLLPKIGTEWERDLFEICATRTSSLSGWIGSRLSVPLGNLPSVDRSHWARTVSLAPTAYNFLGVTRDASQAARDGHDSGNAVTLFSFASARLASAAYAILASRFSFWLWHVTGDGFHTTAALPIYIPVPESTRASARLADLGDELWDEARKQPRLSLNRGRTTVSYPTWMFDKTVSRIDGEIDQFLGTETAELLAEWHERLMVVDVNSNRVERILRKTN